MDSAALGRFLSEARLARELSLAEAARQTHIKQEILVALEQGEFERARVSLLQLRGMLRNYARFLRLDPNQVLTWFDAAREGGDISRPTTPAYHFASADPRKSSPQARASRRWRWLIITVLLLLLSGVLALLALAMARLGDRDVAPPSIASAGAGGPPTVIEQSLIPSPTSLLLAPAKSVADDQDLSSENGISVVVDITQRGWLNAVVDGETRYEGLALMGDQLAFEAEAELRLESANAAGLRVTYLGETLSDLGARGQLIVLTIQHSGIESELGPGLPTIAPITELPVATVTPIDLGKASDPSVAIVPVALTVTSLGGAPAVITEVPLPPIPPSPTAIATSIPASLTPTAILPPRTPMGLPPTKVP